MRRFMLAALTAAPLLAAGSITPMTGDPAPDFTGEWRSFDDTSLVRLRGKLVLIEFWRTW